MVKWAGTEHVDCSSRKVHPSRLRERGRPQNIRTLSVYGRARHIQVRDEKVFSSVSRMTVSEMEDVQNAMALTSQTTSVTEEAYDRNTRVLIHHKEENAPIIGAPPRNHQFSFCDLYHEFCLGQREDISVLFHKPFEERDIGTHADFEKQGGPFGEQHILLGNECRDDTCVRFWLAGWKQSKTIITVNTADVWL